MKAYRSKYCELELIEGIDTLCEIWYIANCPFKEFREICDTILNKCVEFHVKNLIIDASDAISYLPKENQDWLDSNFNARILYETEVEKIIMISPESLVTRISTDKFYEYISKPAHGIFTVKLKSRQEAIEWLKAGKAKTGNDTV
jgi:hypothetical protein